MNVQTVLQTLEKANFKEKKILSYLKKCLKRLSFKSPNDLWNVCYLAEWLYVYGYDDHALQVCQIVDELEFKGDFDIWTPVEALLLLGTRIYREQDGKNKVVAQRIVKIIAPNLPHEEAFRRRLSFDWLNDDNIARCLREGDLKSANVWRFSDLLIFEKRKSQLVEPLEMSAK